MSSRLLRAQTLPNDELFVNLQLFVQRRRARPSSSTQEALAAVEFVM